MAWFVGAVAKGEVSREILRARVHLAAGGTAVRMTDTVVSCERSLCREHRARSATSCTNTTR